MCCAGSLDVMTAAIKRARVTSHGGKSVEESIVKNRRKSQMSLAATTAAAAASADNQVQLRIALSLVRPSLVPPHSVVRQVNKK